MNAELVRVDYVDDSANQNSPDAVAATTTVQLRVANTSKLKAFIYGQPGQEQAQATLVDDTGATYDLFGQGWVERNRSSGEAGVIEPGATGQVALSFPGTPVAVKTLALNLTVTFADGKTENLTLTLPVPT